MGQKSLLRKLKVYSLKFINNLLKVGVVLFFLFPFYWMVITSFKPYLESIQFPPTLWPQNFTLESYVTVFQGMNLLNYAKNSALVTGSIILLQMLVMIPAAYVFAKYDFRGKKLMFALVLAALMIPGQVTFITVYFMMAKWRLLLTLLPQILPFATNAFGIFLLRQSFMQVPEEIIESARLDNASEVKIMCKIMLPMSMSTLITVLLFSFISHWNSYFWPLVMTDSDKVRPLTIAIEQLKNLEFGINWSSIMAGNVILVIPILIIFIFASGKIVKSFTYRGVK